MGSIYRKENGKYVKIAPHEFDGFPADGVWIVKFKNGHESSATCVARLDDLPDPYPFYNMMLDRETITQFLLNIFNGEPVSIQYAADKLIDLLSKLNKPETVDIKSPAKPHKPNFRIPNKNSKI